MKKKLLDLLAKKRGIVDRMRQADAVGDQTRRWQRTPPLTRRLPA